MPAPLIPRSSAESHGAEIRIQKTCRRRQNRKQIAPKCSHPPFLDRPLCVRVCMHACFSGEPRLYFSNCPLSSIFLAICIRKVERYICASIAVLSQVSAPPSPRPPISPVFFCGFFQPVKYLFTVAALYLLLGGARAPFGLRVPALAPRAADDADESKILVIRFENAVLMVFASPLGPRALLGFPRRLARCAGRPLRVFCFARGGLFCHDCRAGSGGGVGSSGSRLSFFFPHRSPSRFSSLGRSLVSGARSRFVCAV